MQTMAPAGAKLGGGVLPSPAAEGVASSSRRSRIDAWLATPWSWAAVWGLLLAVMFATRPILPPDESRYVGVAWEMWQRGDLLVPYLNGVPYSHKPPLLFWAIHFGWFVFGVVDWWARLVPPLFGLGALALLRRLAQEIWGRAAPEAELAPLLLLGCLGWTFFTTTLTFDMLVSACVLLGVLGWWRLGQARSRLELLAAGGLLSAGLGLGLLAKGPVVLAFLMPLGLASRWWLRKAPPAGWGRFSLVALLALGVGVGVALAWALPAAQVGGPAYADAILWHQTADRLVEAKDHPQPFWWYAVLLPLVLFPFSVTPEVWRRLRRLDLGTPSARFALAWAIPGLLLLSLVSAKQPHYLLPLLPALALLGARALGSVHEERPMTLLRWPLVALGTLGFVLAGLDLLAQGGKLPHWLSEAGPGAGLLLLALVLAGLRPRQPVRAWLPSLVAMSVAIFVALHLGVISTAATSYELDGMGRYLAFAEHAGRPIAHVGKYHGQFHFAGRLRRPFTILEVPEIAAWRAANPRGLVLAAFRDGPPPELGEPAFEEPYRERTVAVWQDEPEPSERVEPAGDRGRPQAPAVLTSASGGAFDGGGS